MQKFVNVRSTASEVLSIETDEYHVTVNSGITEIHEDPKEEDPNSGFDGFLIDEQTIYDKDEYIGIISEKNAELENSVNSILTDVIPSLMATE